MKFLLFVLLHLITYTAKYKESDIPNITNQSGNPGSFGQSINPSDYYDKVGLNNDIATVNNKFLSPSHFWTITKNDDIQSFDKEDIKPYTNLKNAIDNSNIFDINSNNPLLIKIQKIFEEISLKGSSTFLEENEYIHFYSINDKKFTIIKLILHYDNISYKEAIGLISKLKNCIVKVNRAEKIKVDKKIIKEEAIEEKAIEELVVQATNTRLTRSFHYRYNDSFYQNSTWQSVWGIQVEIGELSLNQNGNEISLNFNRLSKKYFSPYYTNWWRDEFFNLNCMDPDIGYNIKQEYIKNLKKAFVKKESEFFNLPTDKPFKDNTLSITDDLEGNISIAYKYKYKFLFNQKEAWKVSKYDIKGIQFIQYFREVSSLFWLLKNRYENSYRDEDGSQGVWNRVKKNLDSFFNKMNDEHFIFLKVPNVLLMKRTNSENANQDNYWYKKINFNKYIFFGGIDFTEKQKIPRDNRPGTAITLDNGNSESGFDQNEIFKLETYVSKDKEEKLFPSIVLKDNVSNQIYIEDISYLKNLPEYVETLEHNNILYNYSVKIQNMKITDSFATDIQLIYSIEYINDNNKKIDITESISDMGNEKMKKEIENIIKNSIEKSIKTNIISTFSQQKGQEFNIYNSSFASDILTFSILSKYEYYKDLKIEVKPRSEFKSTRNNNIIKERNGLIEEDKKYSEYIKKLNGAAENIIVTKDNIFNGSNISLYKVTLPLSYEDFKEIYNPLRSEAWNLLKLSEEFNIFYKVMKNGEEFKIKNLTTTSDVKETSGVIFQYGSEQILNKNKKISNESIVVQVAISTKDIHLTNGSDFKNDVNIIIELVPCYREIPKISDEEILSFNGPTPFYNSKDKKYESIYNIIKKRSEKDGDRNEIQENIKFFDSNKDILQTSNIIEPDEEDLKIIDSAFIDNVQKDFYNNIKIYKYNNTKCFLFTPKDNLHEETFELKCFNKNIEIKENDILTLNCNDKKSLLKFELNLVDENNIFGDKKKAQLILKNSITTFICKDKNKKYINAIYPLLIDQIEYNNDDIDDLEHRDTNILHYKKGDKHCLVLELSKLDVGLRNFESSESESEYIDWILEFDASTHVGKKITLQFHIKLKLISDEETNIEEDKKNIFEEYKKSKEQSIKKNLHSSFSHITFNISTKILEERSSQKTTASTIEDDNILNFYSYSSYNISKNCGDIIEIPSNAFDIPENSIKIQFCSENIYYDNSINRDIVLISIYNSEEERYINECEIRQIVGSESGKNFIEIPLSKIEDLFDRDGNVKLRVIIFPTARIRGSNQYITNKQSEFSERGVSTSLESYEIKKSLDDCYIKAKEPIFIECDIVKDKKIELANVQEQFNMEVNSRYSSADIDNIGIADFNLSFFGFRESDNINGIYSHLLLMPDVVNIESVQELKYSMNMDGFVSQYSRAELDRVLNDKAIFTLSRKHSINANMWLKNGIVSRNGFIVEIGREKELKNNSLEELKIRDISFFDNKLKIDIDSRVMPITCKVKCNKDILKQSALVENDRYYKIYSTTFIFEDIDLCNCKEIELSSNNSEYIKEYSVNMESLDDIERYRGKLHRMSVDNPLIDDLINPNRYRYKNLLYKGILQLNGNKEITTNTSDANLVIDVKSVNVAFAKPFVKDGIDHDITSFTCQKTNISKSNLEEKDMSTNGWKNEKDKEYRKDRVVVDTYMDKDDLLIVAKDQGKIENTLSIKKLYELEITKKAGSIQENRNKKIKRDILFDKQFGEKEELFLIEEDEDKFDINAPHILEEEEEGDINNTVLNSKILNFTNNKMEDGTKVINNPQIDGKYFVINKINSNITLTEIEKGHIEKSKISFYKKGKRAEVNINHPIYPIDAHFLNKYLKYTNKNINSLNLDDYIFYLKSQLISNCDTETLVASMMRSIKDKLNSQISNIGKDMIKERETFIKDRLRSIAQRIEKIQNSRLWTKSFFSIMNTFVSCAFNLIPVAGTILSQVINNVVNLIELTTTGDSSFGTTWKNGFGFGFKASTSGSWGINAKYTNFNLDVDNNRNIGFGIRHNIENHNIELNSKSGLDYSYTFQNNVTANIGINADDSFNLGIGYAKNSYKGNANVDFGFDKLKLNIDGEYSKAKVVGKNLSFGSRASFDILNCLEDKHFNIGVSSAYSDNNVYGDRTRKTKAEFVFSRNMTKGYNNIAGSIYLNNKKVFNVNALRDLETGEALPAISDQLSLANLEPLISGAIEESGLSIYEYMEEQKFQNKFIEIIKKANHKIDDTKLKERLDDICENNVEERNIMIDKFIKQNLSDKLNNFIEEELNSGFLFNQTKYGVSESKTEDIVNKFNNNKNLSIFLDKIYSHSDKTKKQIAAAALLLNSHTKEGKDKIISTNSKEAIEAINIAHKACHNIFVKIRDKKIKVVAMPTELLGTNIELHEKAIYREGDKIVLIKYNKSKGGVEILKSEIDSKDINGIDNQIDKINFDCFKDDKGNKLLMLATLNNIENKHIGGEKGKNKITSALQIITSDIKIVSEGNKIKAGDNIITSANVKTVLNQDNKEVVAMDYLKVISETFKYVINKNEYKDMPLEQKITMAANSIKDNIRESTNRIVNNLKSQFDKSVIGITQNTNLSRVKSNFDKFIGTIKKECEKEMQNVNVVVKNAMEYQMDKYITKGNIESSIEKVIDKIDSELAKNIEGYNSSQDKNVVNGVKREFMMEIDSNKEVGIDFENALDKLPDESQKILAKLINDKEITSIKLKEVISEIIDNITINKKDKATLIGGTITSIYKNRVDSYLDIDFIDFYSENRKKILSESHGTNLLNINSILDLDRSILRESKMPFEEFIKRVNKNIEDNIVVSGLHESNISLNKKINNNFQGSSFTKNNSGKGFKLNVKAKKSDIIDELNGELQNCINKEEAAKKLMTFISEHSNSFRTLYEMKEFSSNTSSAVIAGELTKKLLDKDPVGEYNFIYDNKYCKDKPRKETTENIYAFFTDPEAKIKHFTGNNDIYFEEHKIINWGINNGQRIEECNEKDKKDYPICWTIPTNFETTTLSNKTMWIFKSHILIPKRSNS